MSLQVWLPLTKDLRQQGLLQTPAFSLNAFTQESGGKLGQYCYTDRGIIHFTEDFLANQWSLACWVKSTSWSANNDIILCKNASESTNSQFYLSIINGTSLNLGINGGSNNGAGGYSYTFSTNTWYHVAATYNGTNYAMYINGNQVKSGTCTTTKPTGLLNLGIGCRSTNAGGTASTGNANKRLNDVRIYDHCLSPMEVKELAKGLVLHYPLNRQGWGQENLLLNSNDLTLWPIEGNGKIELQEDGYFKVSSKASNTTRYGIYYDFTFPEPNTYTFSVDVKDDWLIGVAPASTFTWTVANLSGTQGKKRISYTCTSTEENNKCRIYIAGNGSGGRVTYLKQPKFEKGSIATPWCPNSADTLASAMGLNGTTEYDCSGYCNNGTRTGTFSWTSNTPKYAVSQIFNGTDNAIQTPSLPTMITDKNYTIAVWIYKTVIGSKNYQTVYGGPSGFELEARNGTTTEAKFVGWNWGKPAAAYEFNEWNHCVFVHSDDDCKVYLNGEYVATGTAKASNPSGNYFIGAWNTATQQNFEGLMSDFRIYATALSASDIKSLYQNSAYIDSFGNVYGAVHTEV